MSIKLHIWRLAMNVTSWSIWTSRLRVAMLRRLSIEIGNGTVIAQGVFIGSPLVRIGAGAMIGMHCFLDGSAPIEIGDEVTVGPFCHVITGTHEILPGRNRRGTGATIPKPVRIGFGSWLGAGASLICASVGESSVVGAGTAVDRDVGPNELVKGPRVVDRRALPVV
ncbi:DapH/DapD/GlmU-related protein [Sphingomonas sp. H160509]|uniref:acyltransferase n=1 Tax=Sphingomonas sp. H160509 TaxID=2955313 RepID=UPI0020970532|nr:DapH/DapD/GlmU-related protein [Sphingomonas sp. H160509]MDD1453014.1 DapH/DapD/GlmU-related protein [Sphingomonas sp. H160509]